MLSPKRYAAKDTIFYRNYKIRYSCFTDQYEIFSQDDHITAFEGGSIQDCIAEIDISYYRPGETRVPDSFYS